jgi:GntR family transcriptional regulator/MocR family aminotransferase
MSMRRVAASFTFLALDRTSPEPMYRQLFAAMRDAIVAGRIAPGAPLPSTRAIADDLGVSRNTAASAFDQLAAEGYIVGRTGSGTYVADALPDECVTAPAGPAPRVVEAPEGRSLSSRGAELAALADGIAGAPDARFAFRISTPALDAFPRDVWSRLVARTRNLSPREALGYGDAAGWPPLRAAIADYVRAARGVRCTDEQVVVVAGSQPAIHQVARLLADPGDVALLEEPGYPGALSALLGAGLRVVPAPVDDEGMNLAAALARHASPRLAYVTPSHQFPLKVTLGDARRAALVEWAHGAGAWVFEDDYDSEFRYTSRPLPSLQGTDPYGRVVHFGTFSKLLFPALRLGYLVLPEDLVDPFVRARIADAPPKLEQMVLADFMREGHLYRHVRRMRALYARRQEVVRREAERLLGDVMTVDPPDAGMYLLGRLDPRISDVAVSRAAAARGVEAQALSPFYREAPRGNGLLLGFACVGPREARAAMRVLQTAVINL